MTQGCSVQGQRPPHHPDRPDPAGAAQQGLLPAAEVAAGPGGLPRLDDPGGRHPGGKRQPRQDTALGGHQVRAGAGQRHCGGGSQTGIVRLDYWVHNR